MGLTGVRIGPLDPDRGENFGQVGSNSTARALVRHHVAMHPPQLVGALQGARNEARSKALNKAEVDEAAREYYREVGEPLPDEAVISGRNVRGEDDLPDKRFVTFTWAVPPEAGGSGRSGKGFIPYDSDLVPNSVDAGDEATRISELKEAGLPWQPVATAQNEEELSRLERRRLEALEKQNELLIKRLEAVEAQQASSHTAGGGSGVASSPQAAEGGSAKVEGTSGPRADVPDGSAPAAGEPPKLPWDGYEEDNADVIRKRVRETDDTAVLEAVVAYERAGKGRGTVITAANEKLDRKPSQ